MLPSISRFDDHFVFLVTSIGNLEPHITISKEPLQIPATLAVPRITNGVETLEVLQMRQLIHRQATQLIVSHVEMAQAAGQRTERACLDARDAVASEDQ